jgi:hypothetical protein
MLSNPTLHLNGEYITGDDDAGEEDEPEEGE